ncbi:MAG: hypothetical protein KGI54_14885 [Pseudomonadota bacterium]|nr:hypothetical protein [Pseudomonadota bacterium]
MTQEFNFDSVQQEIERRMLNLIEDVNFLHASGLTFIESVVQYCEDEGIDVEEIIPMLPPALITKIHDEGVKAKTIHGKIFPTL